MWGMILIGFGALAVLAGLAVTGLGIPVLILGGLAVAAGIVAILVAMATQRVDEETKGESSKPTWLTRRWYE